MQLVVGVIVTNLCASAGVGFLLRARPDCACITSGEVSNTSEPSASTGCLATSTPDLRRDESLAQHLKVESHISVSRT